MSGDGVDYGYGYLTPQPGRPRKSLGRRLSLGAKRAFKSPLSPPLSPAASGEQKSSNSFTRVSMIGEANNAADEQSPVQISPPQSTGRRRLKIGNALRSTVHGGGDERSVSSQPRPEYKRGTSFTPRALKKKLGKNLMKLKSKNVQDPGDLEYLDDSDNSRASHFKGSSSSGGSLGILHNVEDEPAKEAPALPFDDDKSEAGTIVSKSGRRRKKKKDTGDDMASPLSTKKKTRSRSKSRRGAAGDDVSVKSSGSRKPRKASKSRKAKVKVNAWGEEVEEVSEDETYVHSLYGGDDGSTSKPRRRRRKKKQNSVEEDKAKEERRQAFKKQMSTDMLLSKKNSEEVEKRRLALEQELDAMFDRKLPKLKTEDEYTPPPPPPPVHPQAKRRDSAGSRQSRQLSNGKSPRSARRQPKDEEEFEDDTKDDDIYSQEDDLPPIRNLSFSQRRQRTTDVPEIPLKDQISQDNENSNSHKSEAYEYNMGDTTTDEDDEHIVETPGNSRRKTLRDRDGNESVSSKKSVSSRISLSSKRSPRFAKKSLDEVSAGGFSARRNSGKAEKRRFVDDMLDQLEEYETNVDDEQINLRKKLESMAMEKEYLEQKNRQLEFRVEELKEKAAETADRLDTAARNKNQSSKEIEQLQIENDILKQRVQRHEAAMLRMNSSRSIRGMRSIIHKGEDPEEHEQQLAEKDKEITKLKADLALLRDQLRYKTEDYDKQAVELHQARKEVAEARTTLKHTGTFKYHNKFEKLKEEKKKSKTGAEVALSSFFDD
ncbi:unnamed protein product [Cylindrotheca closterium]|uniref:Uncharacterized protein n=1 Tax=Cylindrotheca closterium TaxID=2856 RepID=A0AAD2JNE9_9STRA|nr:unnamed protein product [Cylindrotheca closterium]